MPRTSIPPCRSGKPRWALPSKVVWPFRTPDFPGMPRPIIVFGRSRGGIEDWDTPDGQDTHFIFLVLAPPFSDAQVQILGHIVRTMQEPDLREQLLQADNGDAIWSIFSQAFASKRVVQAPKKRRRQRAETARLGSR